MRPASPQRSTSSPLPLVGGSNRSGFQQTLRRYLHQLSDPWTVTAGLLALIVSIPVLVILHNLFTSPGENWEHIRVHTLPGYLKNTAILVSVAGLLALAIGNLISRLGWVEPLAESIA